MLVCISPSDELGQFETECEDLFHHFQHRNLDALVSAVRTTLDALRRRITTRCIHFTGSQSIIRNLVYNYVYVQVNPLLDFSPQTSHKCPCSHSLYICDSNHTHNELSIASLPEMGVVQDLGVLQDVGVQA